MSFNKSFFLSQSQVNRIKTTIANKEGIIESMVSDKEVFDYIDDQQEISSKGATGNRNLIEMGYDSLLIPKQDIASWLIDASYSY